MNQAAQKEHNERVALYKFYLTSKYKSSFVDYDSMANYSRDLEGYQDPETGTVLRSGILDVVAYPRLEIKDIIEVVGNLDMDVT